MYFIDTVVPIYPHTFVNGNIINGEMTAVEKHKTRLQNYYESVSCESGFFCMGIFHYLELSSFMYLQKIYKID